MKRTFLLACCIMFVIATNLSAQTYSANKDLVDLRAELNDVNVLMKRGIMREEVTGLEYFTGYSYKTLYDWDQYFESIIQIYMGWPSTYMKNGVLLFLKNQKENGFIARSVPSNELHDPEHVKPFLAQISLMICNEYGESNWILEKKVFDRLKKYLDYWLNDMDTNKNGLSEWMSAPHTGMDNQHERAGLWLDHCSEGVDLNCYLVRETKAFARLAEMAGKKTVAAEYRRKSEELKKRIQDLLWDEEDGFFYDRKVCPKAPLSKHAQMGAYMNTYKKKGDLIPVRSISAFTTLFAEVATPVQAKRMVTEYLFNPKEFWTPAPMAALSKSEPWYSTHYMPNDVGCSWRANVWIPTNYMVYHGLRFYGMKDLASIVAHYTKKIVKESGNREYYNSETGEGCGLDPFWGWSLLGHFMDFEENCANDITIVE